jgi:hypothetical protein
MKIAEVGGFESRCAKRVSTPGNRTGDGEELGGIEEGIKISYDAGNVMDYHKINPLPDIRKCANKVRSFCIKDHRL